MNEPGISLLDENTLNVVTNDKNQEEEEDIKEQIKRREELQNLLTNALEDFKYEDSTINSSANVSVVSADYIDQTYRDVQSPYEQLKLLYDIRMKEIHAMKEEFDSLRVNSTEEINSLKRRLTLQEAETSQVEITLRNTKSLLVEKVNTIAEQEKLLTSRDEEISSLKRIIEQLQYDVQAYSTTVNELQHKLTMDTGPFNMAARVFSAEEVQNKHKEQIERLETILNEQRRKIDILEKDRMQLENNLKKTIETNKENELLHRNTVTLLNSNVESAQNQCKDLLNLVEMLSKENDHFRGRVQKLEASEPILLSNSFKRKSLDYDTLIIQNERLKKILLDKDVEVNTLKSKARFYDTDVKELLEFRSIKNKSIFNKDCTQPEHFEIICSIRNDINQLQQEIIKKDQEITHLNSINRELEDKIENMIIQTRSDLENLSHKYKLPELETMNDELQNAQSKIEELQMRLESSQAETEALRSKMSKNDINELKLQLDEEEKKVSALEEILKSKQFMNKQEHNLMEENNELRREVEQLSTTLRGIEQQRAIQEEFNLLKKEYNQLSEQLRELNESRTEMNENNEILTLKEDLENSWHLFKVQSLGKDLMNIKFASWINQLNVNNLLMKKLKDSLASAIKKSDELYMNMKDSEKEIEKLTEIIEELNNSKILLEGEKSALEIEVKQLRDEISHKNEELDAFKTVNKSLPRDGSILQSQTQQSQLEETKNELMNYRKKLLEKCENIEQCEAQIQKLELELKDARENFEASQKELYKLKEIIRDSNVTRCENNKGALEEEDIIKAKILKAEVSIQDELRKEYERKVSKIEERYRNIFETNQQKLNKYKEQENNYRHQLSDLLSKYAQIISPIQKENDEIKEHLRKVEIHYSEMKKYVESSQKAYNSSIEKTRKDAQKAIDSWKIWAKTFVQGCLSIEKLNAQSRNKILNSLKEFDQQVDSVDKYFEEKIRQCKKKNNAQKRDL